MLSSGWRPRFPTAVGPVPAIGGAPDPMFEAIIQVLEETKSVRVAITGVGDGQRTFDDEPMAAIRLRGEDHEEDRRPGAHRQDRRGGCGGSRNPEEGGEDGAAERLVLV